MRLNAVKDPEARLYQVYLNGKKLQNCFEADDVEGYALCYDYTEDGRIKTGDNDKLLYITHRGDVELRKVVP